MLYVKLEFTYFKNNEIKKEWAGMFKYQPSVDIVNDNDNNRDVDVDEDDPPTRACAVDSLLQIHV